MSWATNRQHVVPLDAQTHRVCAVAVSPGGVAGKESKRWDLAVSPGYITRCLPPMGGQETHYAWDTPGLTQGPQHPSLQQRKDSLGLLTLHRPAPTRKQKQRSTKNPWMVLNALDKASSAHLPTQRLPVPESCLMLCAHHPTETHA